MMDTIIELRNVKKRFREYVALNDVSVSFAQGKIHGIIGRNGSGKTVLMKCICGLMHQDLGEIVVSGKKIGKDTDIAEGVGAIIEAPGFLNNYSGMKNLQFLAGIKRTIRKEEIAKHIELVGLDPKSKKHVGKYSLGMRQRLGIAQAIMENQRILILDEPMNGLDQQGVEDMRELFLMLKKQGKTILLASHSKEDIDVLCDEVYEMEHGTLKQVQ
ncbi:multidrug ABC transporter ATP-binding protein [Clostridia bacterium]|nr:multidrug ABC transporter ATP-binding protein [Clostridia bacterium]